MATTPTPPKRPPQVVCAARSLELLWQTIKRHLATGEWHLIDGPSFVVWRWRYQAILQKVIAEPWKQPFPP
jgi:hypothetical protein